tara:strand:+ start:1854 stop:3002 length:1149 start_codon:yes stop_codon:yes gene_type:complete
MISLHRPIFDKKDFFHLKNCFKTNWLSSGGKYVGKLNKEIIKITKSNYSSCLINCTSSLQVALRIAGVNKGDEVIVPTITFISSVNSIIYNSANPVFMDVDKYLNIDQFKTIEFLKKFCLLRKNKFYNKKTKKKISAILVVHTFGNAAHFDQLFEFCKNREIKIIEDAAESIGTIYKSGKFLNKHTGTIGSLGCISFNGNKLISAAGGGAILSHKLKDYRRIQHLINQAKLDTFNFIHDEVGYNMAMSNLHASIGYSQIKKINKYLNLKIKIRDNYKKLFSNFDDLELMQSPNYAKNNYWINILKINNKKKTYLEKVLRNLKQKKIEVRRIWLPNHLQKPFRKFQKYKIFNAQKLVKNRICLPSSIDLNLSDIKKIVNCFRI